MMYKNYNISPPFFLSWFLIFYLVIPEYIILGLYFQDFIAIVGFLFFLSLFLSKKIYIPRIFYLFILIPFFHLFFYGVFNPDRIINEFMSFSRELFIITLCLLFNVKFISRKVSIFLFFVILVFLSVDYMQSIRFFEFGNFAMQQYYDSIGIVLNLPRYVYYRDHISFTPMIVFITTLALQPFYSNRFKMGVFSIFYIFILQSRTYVFYVFFRALGFLRKINSVFFFFLFLLFFLFFFVFLLLYTIDDGRFFSDFGSSRVLGILSSSGREKLYNDVMMRVGNWIDWLSMLVNQSYYFGIGSYGITNKREFVSLDSVYAIDNLFVREFVRYGFFGVLKIAVLFSIFIKTFDKKIPDYCYNYKIFIRYILVACLVNDLLSNVIVRACFYASVVVIYRESKVDSVRGAVS